VDQQFVQPVVELKGKNMRFSCIATVAVPLAITALAVAGCGGPTPTVSGHTNTPTVSGHTKPEGKAHSDALLGAGAPGPSGQTEPSSTASPTPNPDAARYMSLRSDDAARYMSLRSDAGGPLTASVQLTQRETSLQPPPLRAATASTASTISLQRALTAAKSMTNFGGAQPSCVLASVTDLEMYTYATDGSRVYPIKDKLSWVCLAVKAGEASPVIDTVYVDALTGAVLSETEDGM
jgi:hypothetical protein